MIIDYKDNKVSIERPIYETKSFGTTIEMSNKFSYAEDAYLASQSANKSMWKIINGHKSRIK